MKSKQYSLASALFCLLPSVAFAGVFEVGPGREFENLGDVPWELLQAGDEVRIHHREEPYREKFVIGLRATPESPIIIRGIPNEQGERPVIDGRDATTRAALNFWSEERGVVKIGGSNVPADTTPAHIILESLEIRSGREPYFFEGRNGRTAYRKNAASVFVEKGEHILLRDLILRDSGNGLFVAPDSRDIRVVGCRVVDNGVEGSIYEHNAYTQARGILFEHNYFGPLCEGCPGNNLKDRSSGLVVRYNLIVGGNRQLDLVDGTVYSGEPEYASTFVYGNILVEREGDGNRQIVHYGGDSSETDGFRKGVLHFYSNTIVSLRKDRTTLLRLSTNYESAQIRNNLVWVPAGGSTLSLLDVNGHAHIGNNWFGSGWRVSFGDFVGTVVDEGTNLNGLDPGLFDWQTGDYRLLEESDCVDSAGTIHDDVPKEHTVVRQWAGIGDWWSRHDGGEADIGAFELGAGERDTLPDDDDSWDNEELQNGQEPEFGDDPVEPVEGSSGCDCSGSASYNRWLALILIVLLCLFRMGRFAQCRASKESLGLLSAIKR